MSMDLVAQFADSALETVDSCTRTNVAEFEEALAERLVEPAIGAPLTLESVTLEDTAVDTDPSVEDFRTAQTGVARAEVGLANYGTISIESRAGGDELVSLYPPRHVVVLDAADIVPFSDFPCPCMVDLCRGIAVGGSRTGGVRPAQCSCNGKQGGEGAGVFPARTLLS